MKVACPLRSACARPSTLAVFAIVLASSTVFHSQAQVQQSPTAPSPAPSPRTAVPQSTASVTPLRELLDEAERHNPQIAASYHTWQAATHVPKQVSAFPETQLEVQQFSVGSPRPFAGFSNSDFAYIGIGASQDLPYPGKRALRAKVAQREADSLREDSESVRRRIVEALKLAYFRLAYLQQTIGILQRNDQLLQQVQQIVESRYRVGQGNQQDVLKVQLQGTMILQTITTNQQEQGQLQAQIKQILNRSQESRDIVAELLAPTPLRYTVAELLQRVRDQNPDVRARQQMVRSQEAQIELAHKEFRPDFMTQYMYEHTASTFRDYYMATFGMRLPNRGRQRAELAKAEQDRLRAEQDVQTEVQRVLSEVEQQYVFLQSSRERVTIYRDGLIPQSDATFRAGLAAYQSNREDFQTLLSSFLDLLNLDLEYRRELAEHESALARLERLTGVILP